MAQHLYKNYGQPFFLGLPALSPIRRNINFNTTKKNNLITGGGIIVERIINESEFGRSKNQYYIAEDTQVEHFEINNYNSFTDTVKSGGICILAVPCVNKLPTGRYIDEKYGYYQDGEQVQTFTTYRYFIVSNSRLTKSRNYHYSARSFTTRHQAKNELVNETIKWLDMEEVVDNGTVEIHSRQGVYNIDEIFKPTSMNFNEREIQNGFYSSSTYIPFYTLSEDVRNKGLTDYDKFFNTNEKNIAIPNVYEISYFILQCWTRIYTSFPIFGYDQLEDVYNYFASGNTDNALNKDDITLLTLDWSTDWKLYVDGKQPNLKLVWKSEALEKYLDSEENTTKITLDEIKVEVSQNDINGKRVVLDYVPYTNGNYKTNYARLAEKFNMDAWDEFLANIIGSQTGIGDIPIYFRIYYGALYSSLCYCKIPYSTQPTEYGQLSGGFDSESLGDNSTVTVIYGSDGTGDDGYTKPTENDDLPPNGTDGVIGGADVSGVFSRTYLMSNERINQLSAFLWGDSFFQNIKLLNNSPIENIVSCKLMPCAVSGVDEPITLGNVSTGVNGDKTSSSLRVEIGSLNIPEYYHSFLDYAPYTKLTIFLPFIGFKELDTNLFMGKTLTIYYVFDFITGAIKAQLYANNIYVYTFDAIGGIDIPITASNRAQVESGYIKSALTVGAGIASGNALAIGSGILSLATPQYHYNTSGAFSPSCGFHDTRLVYVIYDRPIVQYPSGYNHNIGKPCKLSQNFNSLNGFTIVENGVELSSIPCTAEEREEILQLLSNGVYL